MFVIKRNDGLYVAMPGMRNSYTRFLQYARIFRTREDAERDVCPGNERIVEVMGEFKL